MNKTRLSLYYLVSYLTIGGILMGLFPQFALRFFLSNGSYTEILLRLIGVFLFSLGIVVAGIIYYKVEVLYPVTLLVRLFIISALIIFYFQSRDPMYLVLSGIVGLGLILTGLSYFSEKSKA